MTDTIKTIVVAGVVALLVVVGYALVGGNQSGNLAGTRYQHGLDVTGDGVYAVDGTTVIDGSGNIVAPITSTTGTFSSSLSVAEGFTQGGGWLSTTTTGTLSAAQLAANNGIYIAAAGAGQAAVSMTLPATSTMTALIPTAGDCRDWFIDNSDVAAATTTTIVKGAGWDLVGLDATGAGTGADVLDGLEYGKLTACRQSDTDVIGFLQEYIHAD